MVITQGEGRGGLWVLINKQTNTQTNIQKGQSRFFPQYNFSGILDLNKLKCYLEWAHYQKSPHITTSAHIDKGTLQTNE